MSEAIASARAFRAKPDYKETLDLREVVHLFRDHAGKIILCVVLGIALAVYYLQNAKPIYTSSAMLEVTQRNADGVAPTEIETAELLKTVELKLASQAVLLEVINSNNLAADPEFLATSSGVFSRDSQTVIWLADLLESVDQTVAADFLRVRDEPQPDPPMMSDAELVKLFESKVDVYVLRGSRLISLQVEDRSPERARHLTQAIIDEFFAQSRDARRRETSSSQELLAAEVKRVGDQYRAAQEKLEAYRAKFNAVSLAERQNIVVERLRDLNQQVAAAKNNRLAREAELAQVTRLADAPPDQLLSIRSVADLPEILDLRKQVTLKEAEVAMLGQRYGPLHPTMAQAKSELSELTSSFHGAIRKATNRIRESYESAKAMEQSLEKALAQQETAALELDRIAIPYNSLQREAEASGEMYQKILDEVNRSTVARGLTSMNDANGIDIRIVEPPLAPIHPSQPRRNLLLALSVATGLFVGCGLALGSRAMDTSVTSVDSAEATLGLPVLATIPRTGHHRLNARPVILRYPASAQAEAFRSLRTALSLAGEEEARCVLFTSAVPDEGKSFCSLNCAAAYAQQGMKTLLIDADMRRPSLNQLFSDPSDRPDLTACLRDPSKFSEAVQPTRIENLYRLGDWRHEPGSAELVARNGMREILEIAGHSFNRVVIDSAPLMAVSDTLYIAQHVPTICLVIYAGKTPRRVAKRALKMLDEVSKRSATGLVLNKIRKRGSAEHYYYYNA
jgi:capsular exopolysaccharide synthesis family protein